MLASKLANQCIGKVNRHGFYKFHYRIALGIWVFYIIKMHLNMNCWIIKTSNRGVKVWGTLS